MDPVQAGPRTVSFIQTHGPGPDWTQNRIITTPPGCGGSVCAESEPEPDSSPGPGSRSEMSNKWLMDQNRPPKGPIGAVG